MIPLDNLEIAKCHLHFIQTILAFLPILSTVEEVKIAFEVLEINLRNDVNAMEALNDKRA